MTQQNVILTAAQIEQYARDGVLILRGLFGLDDLVRYRQAVDDICALVAPLERGKPRLQIEPEQDNGQNALRMLEPLIDLSPILKELAYDRRLLDPIEQIYGERAYLFEDKLSYKPARVGSGFKLHQDSTYWREFSRNIISAFVHIDDATIENGCLQVVPGFHNRGFIAWTPEKRDHMIQDEQIANAERLMVVAKAGDVILFHCLTPHASEPNRTDQPRRALIFSYTPASDGDQYRFSEEVINSEYEAQRYINSPSS